MFHPLEIDVWVWFKKTVSAEGDYPQYSRQRVGPLIIFELVSQTTYIQCRQVLPQSEPFTAYFHKLNLWIDPLNDDQHLDDGNIEDTDQSLRPFYEQNAQLSTIDGSSASLIRHPVTVDSDS